MFGRPFPVGLEGFGLVSPTGSPNYSSLEGTSSIGLMGSSPSCDD